MKKYIALILINLCGILTCSAQSLKLKKIFADAEDQTDLLLQNIASIKKTTTNLVSPRTLLTGNVKLVHSGDWTSGFFPGILWYLYEYTGREKWKQQAQLFTASIEKEKTNARTHDLGFMIYCPFGNGLRLAPNEHYKEVIIQSARTLCTRFDKVVGAIKSWDGNRDKWLYPVIIDNMMNLELLFSATQLTGDSSFYKIAVTHANTTLRNHFRPDNSAYHLLDYDTITGKIIKKITVQGYANESAWARGQAWGMYGFTVCYRFTKDPRYLLQAEKIAAYIINNPNLPADHIPYWDHNAPGIPAEERDASAAAIFASGLYELSIYSKNRNEYKKEADKILVSLTHRYRSPTGENKGFILLHSTGHKPANSEVNVPMIYADYYYLEALLRKRNFKKSFR